MPGTILRKFLGDPAHDGPEVLLFQRATDTKAIEALAVDLHGAEVARGLTT